MILTPKPSLKRKLGFTLIEVVICVTIIGVISSIAIPSLKFFINQKEDLEIEQECLMIKDDIYTFLSSYQNSSSDYKYPVVALASSESLGTIGVVNVNQSQMVTNGKAIANNITLLSYSTNYKSASYDVDSSFVKKICYARVTIRFKDSRSITLTYQISDNQVDYRDMALLYSFTYTNKVGNTKTMKV